jgi:hypothetical protein
MTGNGRVLAQVSRRDVGRRARPVMTCSPRSHHASFSVGCYCEDESRCHRSLLRKLLVARRAAGVVRQHEKTDVILIGAASVYGYNHVTRDAPASTVGTDESTEPVEAVEARDQPQYHCDGACTPDDLLRRSDVLPRTVRAKMDMKATAFRAKGSGVKASLRRVLPSGRMRVSSCNDRHAAAVGGLRRDLPLRQVDHPTRPHELTSRGPPTTHDNKTEDIKRAIAITDCSSRPARPPPKPPPRSRLQAAPMVVIIVDGRIKSVERLGK